MDQTDGRVEFEREESVILGSWEVTYHSGQISESIESSLQKYDASDGCQFVSASFTIRNVGLQRESFLGISILDSDSGIQVGLVDGSFENYFEPVQLWAYTGGLDNSSLEPGDTKDGELVFEVPDDVINSSDGVYIVIIKGYQMAVYPLGE